MITACFQAMFSECCHTINGFKLNTILRKLIIFHGCLFCLVAKEKKYSLEKKINKNKEEIVKQ